MIRKATKYNYPVGHAYNETVATLEDGRIVTVDTQYAVVLPHGDHAEDCDQVRKIGGRCTCGLLNGIDVAALVADARENGLMGSPPKPEPSDAERIRHRAELDEYERSTRAIWKAMGVDPDID